MDQLKKLNLKRDEKELDKLKDSVPINVYKPPEMSAKDRMNQPFPVRNPDRFAVVSVVAGEGENSCFLKIHTMAPTQGAAEGIAQEAARNGYVLETLVADTAHWLPLPPGKIAKSVHINDKLTDLIGKQIEQENVQFNMVKARRVNAHAKTAFDRHQNLIMMEAENLITKMIAGGEPDSKQLMERFKKFQKKEVDKAQKEAQDPEFKKRMEMMIEEKKRQDDKTAREAKKLLGKNI